VRLELKRPWSDGTLAIALAPTALIARLAALVPPPRRHTVRYFGVLSSHSKLRPQVIPPLAEQDATADPAQAAPDAKAEGGVGRGRRSHYIPWAELLSRTFAIDVVCGQCGGELRLIALVKTEATIKKILTAMGLPAEPPPMHPPRPPPRAAGEGEGWLQ
jgi:Putative transposase